MKREEGYYWVKTKEGDWEPAHWRTSALKKYAGKFWWSCMYEGGKPQDKDLAEIGPRILPPVPESQTSDVSKEQLPLFENS